MNFTLSIRKSPWLALLFLLVLAANSLHAASPDKGKELFKANCKSCHNPNMKDDMTGPALGPGIEHWSSFPPADLHKWIRNSGAMISSGHPRATEVWGKWKPTVMTPFPNLKDEEIDDILSFIEGTYKGTYGTPAPAASTAVAGGEDQESSNLIYILLVGVLAILALILARVVSNLNYHANVKEGEPAKEPKSIGQILTSKSTIGIIIFALIVLGGYTTLNNGINLGRQQNYQPDQPIKFSHATHAGINKIDCQYCHDGARRSKQSLIPGTNTCMNCHKAIKTGSKYGTQEITKIYASIGFDPNTDKYIPNYENLPESAFDTIYKKWIATNYEKNNAGRSGTYEADVQWKNIKASLTNEQKKTVQGAIEWTRIHTLPDHVYFNHSQHVAVGKVACQQCHGKIEGMEVVKQYSPLSMGWCINCHRETEVKFKDNKFYDAYTRYHEEIKDGKRDKVTVEEIGGLECQKCHY